MPEYTDDQIKELVSKAKEEAKAENLKAEIDKGVNAHLGGLRKASEAETAKAVEKAALEARESTRKELLEKIGLDSTADDKKVSSYSKLQTELEATRKQTEELNARVLSEEAKRQTAQTRSELLEAGVNKDMLSDALILFKTQQSENNDLKIEDFLKAKPWFATNSSAPEQKPNGIRIATSAGVGKKPVNTIDLDKVLEEGRKSSIYSG
jgi:hypothetical protein